MTSDFVNGSEKTLTFAHQSLEETLATRTSGYISGSQGQIVENPQLFISRFGERDAVTLKDSSISNRTFKFYPFSRVVRNSKDDSRNESTGNEILISRNT